MVAAHGTQFEGRERKVNESAPRPSSGRDKTVADRAGKEECSPVRRAETIKMRVVWKPHTSAWKLVGQWSLISPKDGPKVSLSGNAGKRRHSVLSWQGLENYRSFLICGGKLLNFFCFRE
jgi:hypothetical protein